MLAGQDKDVCTGKAIEMAAVGFELWQREELNFERDFFIARTTPGEAVAIRLPASYQDMSRMTRAVLENLGRPVLEDDGDRGKRV
eukprot:8581918-Karenia_brevis.AAC.1